MHDDYDEVFAAPGEPREHAQALAAALTELGPERLAARGARTVRDVFRAEMWEAINTFHLGLLRRDNSAALPTRAVLGLRIRERALWPVLGRHGPQDAARRGARVLADPCEHARLATAARADGGAAAGGERVLECPLDVASAGQVVERDVLVGQIDELRLTERAERAGLAQDRHRPPAATSVLRDGGTAPEAATRAPVDAAWTPAVLARLVCGHDEAVRGELPELTQRSRLAGAALAEQRDVEAMLDRETRRRQSDGSTK